jgi:hypothetical protein
MKKVFRNIEWLLAFLDFLVHKSSVHIDPTMR